MPRMTQVAISKAELRTELDKLIQIPAHTSLCDKCGGRTACMILDLALFETEHKWHVEIPFCQRCEDRNLGNDQMPNES